MVGTDHDPVSHIIKHAKKPQNQASALIVPRVGHPRKVLAENRRYPAFYRLKKSPAQDIRPD